MGVRTTNAGSFAPAEAGRESYLGPGRSIGTEPVPPLPLFDAELGQIFIRMRGITGLGVWDMARKVGTDPTVIANLEAGALDALPDWTEVVRIVEAYAGLAQVDGRPILSRMLQGYGRHAPQVTAPITAYLPPEPVVVASAAPPIARAVDADDVQEIVPYDVAEARRRATTVQPITVTTVPERARHARRTAPAATADTEAAEIADDDAPRFRLPHWPFLAAIPILLMCVILLLARTSPRVLYFVLVPVPEFARSPIERGVDRLVTVMAPKRDGLVWIDTGDPRARRRDKLQEWGR